MFNCEPKFRLLHSWLTSLFIPILNYEDFKIKLNLNWIFYNGSSAGFCTLKAVKGTIVICALSKTKDNMFDPSILVSVHLSKFDWAVFLNYSVFFNQFYILYLPTHWVQRYRVSHKTWKRYQGLRVLK